MSVTGCGPSGVEVPPIRPKQAAESVMAKYDTSGDGELSVEEIAVCPSLVDAMDNIDADHNRRLSEQEIEDRFKMWVEGGVGAAFLTCSVTQGGRPLPGAKVRFIPEDFLRDVVQPAEGITNSNGAAKMSIDKANLPSDLQGLRAVQQGLYRVEITHDSIDIPPKYNTESELGLEVSFEKGRSVVRFKL
jgi:hypothetical protein